MLSLIGYYFYITSIRFIMKQTQLILILIHCMLYYKQNVCVYTTIRSVTLKL